MNNLDGFKGKDILLVCAETYSWPMHYVGQKLRGVCHKLGAIFIQPGESYFNNPEYKQFKKLNNDIDLYEMSSVAEEYISKQKNASEFVDWAYIKKIEEEYSRYSPLNEQILAEMTLLPYYHDRNYYDYIDYAKIMFYVQLYYKYMEDLIDKVKPDLILDTDVDFFGRAVLLEVASKNNIPYIALDYSRINSYVLPTNSLVKNINPQIRDYFNKSLLDDTLENDPKLKNTLVNTEKVIGEIPEVFKEMHLKNKFNAVKLLKQLIIQNIVFLRYLSIKRIKLNRIKKITSPICSDLFKGLWAIYMYYIRRFYLQYVNVFEKCNLKNIDYIFVPLHVIPESSTTVMSPYYINETFIIESLSKAVKANQFIVVKEHWSMIGHRPLSYYAKIKRLPNVILIDPTMSLSPREYIEYSDLVVTISGSSALEGAFMGKNSLVFSDVIYNLLSCAKRVCVDENFSDTVESHMNYVMPKIERLAYLKTIIFWGEQMNLKPLLSPPDRIQKKDLDTNVDKLLNVYLKGLDLVGK